MSKRAYWVWSLSAPRVVRVAVAELAYTNTIALADYDSDTTTSER